MGWRLLPSGKLTSPQDAPGADNEVPDSLGVLSLDSEIYQVEVWCGEFKIFQDIRQCASQNMLHHLVFKSCLKRCERWDPNAIAANVDKLIKKGPPLTTEYQGETYWCHGLFSVPMIVDGVKTQQRATVTYQDIPNQDFALGRGFLESTGLRRAIDSYGRVVIVSNASTAVR